MTGEAGRDNEEAKLATGHPKPLQVPKRVEKLQWLMDDNHFFHVISDRPGS
jgi:hypothetical protein